jgi:glycosyltransferase involved in cell wall biosynthesis
MNDQVDILLATFQGGLYLKEQLLSLIQQSYSNFHIFIRDDGSTDQTVTIIESFRKIYPERITVIPSAQCLGVKGNFSELMHHTKAKYIMFCDQDDIWLPHKIKLSLDKMKTLENQHGPIPLLVHTDLQVVKSDLTLIARSFWKYSKLDPSKNSLNDLLSKNTVTGCALMINQKLLELAYPIPDQCIMHDWWIVLVATIFGKIEFIKEAPILYRQHGKNAVGALKFNFWYYFKRQIIRKLYRKYHPFIVKQAQTLFLKYFSLMNPYQKKILQEVCTYDK